MSQSLAKMWAHGDSRTVRGLVEDKCSGRFEVCYVKVIWMRDDRCERSDGLSVACVASVVHSDVTADASDRCDMRLLRKIQVFRICEVSSKARAVRQVRTPSA